MKKGNVPIIRAGVLRTRYALGELAIGRPRTVALALAFAFAFAFALALALAFAFAPAFSIWARRVRERSA
ncbi:MAG: hypothetical protein IPK60_06545 [Sandaracinaceae bacterium]|nr:hypothetical protein [Sandaracinaceae bacterium]